VQTPYQLILKIVKIRNEADFTDIIRIGFSGLKKAIQQAYNYEANLWL
jgi:hypothetical protein